MTYDVARPSIQGQQARSREIDHAKHSHRYSVDIDDQSPCKVATLIDEGLESPSRKSENTRKQKSRSRKESIKATEKDPEFWKRHEAILER